MTPAPVDTAALLETIETIYDAGFDRLRWPVALRAIAALIDAPVALLCARRTATDGQTDAWQLVASDGLSAAQAKAYAHWLHADPLLDNCAAAADAAAAAASPHDAAEPRLRQIRRIDGQELPFFLHFADEVGLDSGMALGSGEQGGLALLVWRTGGGPSVTAPLVAAPLVAASSGAVPLGAMPFGIAEQRALRRVWPHVVRARSLLARDWARSGPPAGGWAEELLERWPVGIVCLSAGGAIRHANRMARGFAEARDGFGLAFDGPVASTATETRSLRSLIRLIAERDPPEDEWLRLTRPSGRRAYEVALRGTLATTATPRGVTMLLADPEQRPAVSLRALRTLHRLTPVEADVASRLARGVSIDGIATDLHLSVKTTRWYVEQLREKFGARSQMEVVRLILTGPVSVRHDGEHTSPDRGQR